MKQCLIGLASLYLAPCVLAQTFSFQNITPGSGLVYSGVGPFGCGISIGDYDLDGWDDVLMMGALGQKLRLFRNNGNKTFTDVTASVLPSPLPNASGALFIDLDNDGDKDLVLARWYGNFQDVGYYYLVNNGGVYALGANSDAFCRGDGRLGGLAAADVDFDGDLDIVLSHYFGYIDAIRNDGIMNMFDAVEIAGPAVCEVYRRHWSTVLADFDNDGDSDLHVAIDYGEDVHFHNNRHGNFTEVSAEVGVTNIGADMGLAVGDMDNDGDLDIYSTNVGNHCLYVNDGFGNFVNEAQARGVLRTEFADLAFGWGCAWADFDLDMDLDLVMLSSNGTGCIYENDGTGHFSFAYSNSGLELDGYSLVPFDMDRDGDIDLLSLDMDTPPRLQENLTNTAGRHWLIVQARGVVSNRDSIGARVYVTVGGVTQMREILSSQSFYGGFPLYQHFGLGGATHADRVEVVWPSGRRRVLVNVPGDQRITMKEPATPSLWPSLSQDGEHSPVGDMP